MIFTEVDRCNMNDFRDGTVRQPGEPPPDKRRSARSRGGVRVELLWAYDPRPRLPKGRVTRGPRRLRELRPPRRTKAIRILTARLRLGVVLPNGRVAGHSDQCVHLFPISGGCGVPSQLRAYCGMAVEPGMAEIVSAASGAPCLPCLLGAPERRWPPEGLVY